MLSFTGGIRILLRLEPCDMRMGFNGLHGLVQSQLKEDVKGGALFVFTNRTKTRLKILFWDGSGLWLLAKRLEKGTFAWPKPSAAGQEKLQLAPAAFAMLTDGIDLRRGCRRAWYEEPDKTGFQPSSGRPGPA